MNTKQTSSETRTKKDLLKNVDALQDTVVELEIKVDELKSIIMNHIRADNQRKKMAFR